MSYLSPTQGIDSFGKLIDATDPGTLSMSAPTLFDISDGPKGDETTTARKKSHLIRTSNRYGSNGGSILQGLSRASAAFHKSLNGARGTSIEPDLTLGFKLLEKIFHCVLLD
jgi:hypothetical protein